MLTEPGSLPSRNRPKASTTPLSGFLGVEGTSEGVDHASLGVPGGRGDLDVQELPGLLVECDEIGECPADVYADPVRGRVLL